MIFLANETATLAFGAQLAASCPASCLIFLNGDLGAGKTTLVRGFLQGLGYQGLVKSPTYTLVESYEIANKTILHFDLYRLQDPEELTYIGMRDYLNQPAIVFIEWPERGGDQLPIPDLTFHMEPFAAGRRIEITANTERGRQLLQKLSS